MDVDLVEELFDHEAQEIVLVPVVDSSDFQADVPAKRGLPRHALEIVRLADSSFRSTY